MEVVVKINRKPLSLKMSTTLRIGSSGSAFCRNWEQGDAKAETNFFEVLVCIFNTLYCFSFTLNR